MPYWGMATQASIDELVNADSETKVQRWGLDFDRFSSGVLTVGGSLYSNASSYNRKSWMVGG